MSAFRNVTRGLRNLWDQGGDEFDELDDPAFSLSAPRQNAARESVRDTESSALSAASPAEPMPSSTPSSISPASASVVASRREPGREPGREPIRESRPFDTARPRPTTPSGSARPSSPRPSAATPAPSGPGAGGLGAGGSARPRRPMPSSMRPEAKNIHTFKPRNMDEVSLVADYLKTGCAVVVNLETLERAVAVRVIDFMSGVCYGLENQGRAMKLGEAIFLFTPGEYEILSEDEYSENRDVIFKDLSATASAPKEAEFTAAPERRSWER